MDLLEQMEAYHPFNEQEEMDQKLILKCLRQDEDIFTRKNSLAHMTASAWVVNQDRTRVLMAYHNIYDSWSWLGGHAEVFLPLHSKTRWTKISSDPVPPGTPKLFAIHSSLFSFSARSQARAKNKGIPTQFSGDARELLPARAILSHLYAVCGHPKSGLF